MRKHVLPLTIAAVTVIVVTAVLGMSGITTKSQEVRGMKEEARLEKPVELEKYIDLRSTKPSEANLSFLTEELTSEKYFGRLTGTEGNKKAADLIADYFELIGLQSPEGLTDYKHYYGQPIRLINTSLSIASDKGSGQLYKNQLVSHYNQYTNGGESIAGKKCTAAAHVIKSIDELSSLKGDKESVLFLSKELLAEMEKESYKLNFRLSDKNITGIVMEQELTPGDQENTYPTYPVMYNFIKSTVLDTPIMFYCDAKTFKDITKSLKKGTLVSMEAKSKMITARLPNVIGVIKGSGSSADKEFVLLSAHFDHLGVHKNGEYFAGAWDNASGTAVMMEAARVLAASGVKPEKDLIFVAFNGEEQGLRGSFGYRNDPVYPLENTKVINLDSLGPKEKTSLTIASYTGSDESVKLQEEFKELCELSNIRYSIQTSADNTDHYPFAMSGYEAISLEQLELSNWHRTTDTSDSLSYKDMAEKVDIIVQYIKNDSF